MNTAATPRILLLDDDLELSQLLTDYLRGDGFEASATTDIGLALNEALTGRVQLLLLDVMLAQANGFDVLRQIRSRSDLPVVMLTARGDELDRILGLELGADDYVPKPFHPRELAARVRAVLRRTQVSDSARARAPAPLVLGDVRLEPGTRRVFREGALVPTTSVEFSLLEVLVRAAGQLVSREELFKRVLGRRIVPFDRSIDMHISNLRRKLGHRIGDVERIQSVRGEGYLYAIVETPT
ncbi:MAG: response regulator transcription factor [Phycisphaerae bacterium]|nr:response regulator transcription factor [Phycisphaerae bacterium]